MKKKNREQDKAVALRYDKKRENAPRVLAKGKGETARRIVEKAEDYGITLYRDDDLVEVLAALELDTEIPNELYKAVAEVMVFVYRLNGQGKQG